MATKPAPPSVEPFPPFKLERYFARYEFTTRYLLSASDCESLTLSELLAMADADSLRRWESLSLAYTESQGLPVLRDEVARLTPDLSADDVMILVPEEGIYIAMLTLLEPGDHVVCVWPAYQSLYEVARSHGCEVTPWRAQVVDGVWRFDLDDLRRSITPRTKLLVVNFPHNPTGYLPSRDEFDQVVACADRHGIAILSDEMYRGLEYDQAGRLPAACTVYDRGISLSGLSKTYALPGLRIGWLATRNREWVRRWATAKDYTTICSSAPSEVLALMALRAGDRIMARNLAIIAANLYEAECFFTDYPTRFVWLPPRAGSVAFPLWRGPGSVEQFCQGLLESCSVMIVPGSVFDMPGEHFRLGLGRRNFAEAMGQVRGYLDATSAL